VNQADLVNLIANILTQLDNALMNLDPSSASWQQLYALRKHLDDQQRALVASIIQTNDPEFAAATGVIQTATNQLNQQINAQNKIDAAIKTISQVSASLDQILKMVP